jgi:hypothetical protein
MPPQQAQSDPWVEAAKNFKAPPQGEAAPAGGGNDDWKVWQGGESAEQPSTIQKMQNSFDKFTTPEGGHGPITNAMEKFGASAMRGAGDLFVHPIEAAKSLAGTGANLMDPTGTLAHAMGQPNIPETIKQMATHPIETAGGAVGGAVLGMGAGEIGAGLGRAGSALRSAAIGDPDAAALRALNVPPKSPHVQSTLNAVAKSRPYLSGARNLEDLQSRIPPAKSEIWSPYQQGVEAIGDRPVQGPGGMSDVRGLEDERQQMSALNRDLRSRMPNPESVRLAEQKGMGQADLLQHERAVKAALDPELASTGIKPGAIRSTYGGVSKVGERVSGRSTIGEESQPYGLGKLSNIDITKPLSMVKPVFEAGRDIVAGRPLFSGKPTDVAVRDAFRAGGPKPDLGTLRAPSLAAAQPLRLPSPAAQLGRAPEPGGTPEGYQPPPFYHDTAAMRRGMLLEAPPIQLGGHVEGTPPPMVHPGTTAMRQGRLLPPPSPDVPLSSHADIFPEQRPGSSIVKKTARLKEK